MCDYDYASQNKDMREKGIGSYVEREEGIKRLGVVRADIDNLGATFISEFQKNIIQFQEQLHCLVNYHYFLNMN